MLAADAAEEDGDVKEETSCAFPRLSDRPAVQDRAAEGEVLVRVQQRRGSDRNSSFEVHETADGASAIPMSVQATTISSWVARDVLLRSPWFSRCLSAPQGGFVSRELGSEVADEAQGDFEEIMSTSSRYEVIVRREEEAIFEVGLPSAGIGQRLLLPRAFLQCLDLCAPDAPAFDASTTSVMTLFTYFLWAAVLELTTVLEACRKGIIAAIDATTVALALSVANATNDTELLRHCYWFIREQMCSVGGPLSGWLDGRGTVRLVKGVLCYKDVCRTPLRCLASIVDDDRSMKRRWITPQDCYTLTQVHRVRQAEGGYPHTYEMRLDHTDEVLLTALREDEQSACKIFAHNSASSTMSEHCKEFLGAVEPNFWGTLFTLYDGTDVDALVRSKPGLKDLPMRRRDSICQIGFSTNILGDSPRKISVDFERGNEKYHMENVSPRWDAKLNSYALPFFGRVKKASAKNFQLVVNNDPNTIFLMFGKISKDVFCLDFRGPLAPLDAIAIAIASLAKKRAVS